VRSLTRIRLMPPRRRTPTPRPTGRRARRQIFRRLLIADELQPAGVAVAQSVIGGGAGGACAATRGDGASSPTMTTSDADTARA
jgi:hypothetical protein